VAEPPIPRSSVELGIVCQEFVELVTEHLEGTLPEAVERVVAEHLDLCDPCTVYLEQMRSTTAALRTLPEPTLPPATRARLLDAFSALHGGMDPTAPN
jgi:predicted anti-sigma-YlaC factor YlaD